MDPAVAAKFAAYPADIGRALLQLRTLIYETADNTEGVGPLEETLKWGQISYLTAQSRSGTTLRLDVDTLSGRVALYVNCKTDLVSRYRTLYRDTFAYQGDRAVILPPDPDWAAMRHVIALALTYHAGKRTR